MKALHWDIFCKVIDNYGDWGVCWRLTRQLLERGQSVRLYLDDMRLLTWMADAGTLQHHQCTVLPWSQATKTEHSEALTVGDVVIEAFGCELPLAFQARIATQTEEALRNPNQGKSAPVWINLEYLSAEPYVQRCHGLQSPIHSGPARGLSKWFFYPGFSLGSGGLLRDHMHAHIQAHVQSHVIQANNNGLNREQILQSIGIPAHSRSKRIILLFCYANPALLTTLERLAAQEDSLFLVTFGQSTKAVQALWPHIQAKPNTVYTQGKVNLYFLPALTQAAFDALLRVSDINLVRGEDSVVQALWAEKPMLWQIYPQQDDAHIKKLQAFLDVLQADDNARAWHMWWNGLGPMPNSAIPSVLATSALRAQDDLCSQLLAFVNSKQSTQ